MDQNKVLDAGFQQVAEILSRWRSFRGHNPHRFCENEQWYKYISNLTDYILILNLFFPSFDIRWRCPRNLVSVLLILCFKS